MASAWPAVSGRYSVPPAASPRPCNSTHLVNTRTRHSYHVHTIEREMFYLMTHSTHFIYGYMASDIWLRTILIVRKETSCRHIGYSYRLTARVLLYAPPHIQDNTYHGLCYTSRGALAGTRNSSMVFIPSITTKLCHPLALWQVTFREIIKA